ncbi:MAG: hypothetical protein ACJA1A_000074 [Saprospiraceae bacterium]|jgi:hypothetical protein
MIQRIQSIFLLLASITFFLQFVFNFATSDKTSPGFLSDKLYNVLDNPVLLGLTILGGAIALFSIFLFRNRPLQLRLSYLVIVICILLPIVAFLLIYNEPTGLSKGVEINDGLAIYLPVIGLITTIFATRFINKDNKLVKSMDRLR